MNLEIIFISQSILIFFFIIFTSLERKKLLKIVEDSETYFESLREEITELEKKNESLQQSNIEIVRKYLINKKENK